MAFFSRENTAGSAFFELHRLMKLRMSFGTPLALGEVPRSLFDSPGSLRGLLASPCQGGYGSFSVAFAATWQALIQTSPILDCGAGAGQDNFMIQERAGFGVV